MLAKLGPGGGLDPTFGNGGFVRSDIVGYADGLAVQADGKILIGGSGSSPDPVKPVTIQRYSPTGQLDTSWGVGGTLTRFFVNDSGGQDLLKSLAVLPDGKVLVAGERNQFGAVVARLTSAGGPDTSFGTDGLVNLRTRFPAANLNYMRDMAVQPDGRIVVLASTGFGGTSASVMRLTDTGAVDTFFDADGIAPVSMGTAYAVAVAPGPEGRIVVAGESSTGTFSTGAHAAEIYNAWGATFSTGGVLVTRRIDDGSLAQDVVVHPNGNVLLVGTSRSFSGTAYNIAVVAIRPNFTVDETLSRAHTVGPASEYGNAAALAPDGRLVIAGASESQPGASNLIVGRMITPGLGTISGRAFNDANGNGSADEAAAALPAAGRTVYLDANNNAARDPGEQYATTASDGSYVFDGLTLGTYNVRLAAQAGWLQTTPAQNAAHTVNLTSPVPGTFPLPVRNRDFGTREQATGGIIQTGVFRDTNGDGQSDPLSFPGFPYGGWTIYIDADLDGVRDAGEFSAVTDPNGFAPLVGVPAGTHRLRAISPFNGYEVTFPASTFRTITVPEGQTVLDTGFGVSNVGLGVVSGVAFLDADNDGIRDTNETPVAGAIMFIDEDGDHVRDPLERYANTSGANGAYGIVEIPVPFAGTTVKLVALPPAGYAGLHGNGAYTEYAVNLGGGFPNAATQNLAFRTAAPVTTVTLRAAADAYVRDGSYAGQNFGSAAELQLKQSSSAGSTREIYLRFDLSNVASVANAKLRLFGRIDHATQAPQVGVYPVANTSWAENTINWNNRPPLGASGGVPLLASQVVSTGTPKWYEFDVTSYLAAEKAAGRNLVTLAVRSLANTDPYLIFASDEAAANKPELVVTPNGGTPPPPPQEIVVSANAVTVPEGSKSSFTVRLASQPASDVVVTVARTAGDTDLSVAAPSTLTFTPANWSTPQGVWIAGAEDADSTNGSASFTVSSTGLTSRTVTATEADNDPAGPQPLTLGASADAYVRDGTYAGQNFGTATQLIVKRNTTSSNTRETYLRFNLNEFDGASAATLRLFARSNNAAQGVVLNLFAADNVSWSETGITWNNRPAAGTAALGTRTVAGTGGAWYEFDVTQYVQQRKAAGAAAVTFVLKAGTNTDAQAVIESDESASASSRPQLVVTPGTPPPPPQGFIVSAEQLAVPEGGTATFTVRLAAQPAGDVNVRVIRSAGDFDIVADAVPGGATGVSLTFTAANWNVPQIVPVAAAQDADTTHGTATIRIAAVSGPAVPVREITATEVDDDAPTGPTVLRAAADAYVRDGTSAGQNFGSSTELQLKKSGTGSNREVFFKFDLTSLTSVSTAKLRVFGRIDSSTERPSVAVFGASDTLWSESGITWNNRPAAGATALATTIVAGSTATWHEWDLTTYLQAHKAAGATAVTLVLGSLTTTTPHMIFSSDEAPANRPELVVTP